MNKDNSNDHPTSQTIINQSTSSICLIKIITILEIVNT